jgi:ankyrin repeat/IBR domain-containing protein 1
VNEKDEEEGEELYRGLRAVDLQEAKDLLLVETSDMLHIPLFSAEALLRQHGKKLLIESGK